MNDTQKPKLATALVYAFWACGGPAMDAWLHTTLSRLEGLRYERMAAAWELLGETERRALLDLVIEGEEDAMERVDVRVPYVLVRDLAGIWDVVQGLG